VSIDLKLPRSLRGIDPYKQKRFKHIGATAPGNHEASKRIASVGIRSLCALLFSWLFFLFWVSRGRPAKATGPYGRLSALQGHVPLFRVSRPDELL
jgi:hypothetical protein